MSGNLGRIEDFPKTPTLGANRGRSAGATLLPQPLSTHNLAESMLSVVLLNRYSSIASKRLLIIQKRCNQCTRWDCRDTTLV